MDTGLLVASAITESMFGKRLYMSGSRTLRNVTDSEIERVGLTRSDAGNRLHGCQEMMLGIEHFHRVFGNNDLFLIATS